MLLSNLLIRVDCALTPSCYSKSASLYDADNFPPLPASHSLSPNPLCSGPQTLPCSPLPSILPNIDREELGHI